MEVVENAIHTQNPTNDGLKAGQEKSCAAVGKKRDYVWV